MRVLLLGGTAEARELAAALVAAGVDVVTSLAGRVARPRLPEGQVRVGGFGGVAGLRAYAEGFDAVVDATHPFATRITENAAAACVDVPLLRLVRPGWSAHDRADWTWVGSHDEAARAAVAARRPFLTVGRQELGSFTAALASHRVLARVVDAPEEPVPPDWRVLRSRGPYTLDAERELLRRHGVDVLVTKDSGGEHTRPKLDAAAELGVRVVVVARPPVPEGLLTVPDVGAVLRWLRSPARTR